MDMVRGVYGYEYGGADSDNTTHIHYYILLYP